MKIEEIEKVFFFAIFYDFPKLILPKMLCNIGIQIRNSNIDWNLNIVETLRKVCRNRYCMVFVMQ